MIRRSIVLLVLAFDRAPQGRVLSMYDRYDGGSSDHIAVTGMSKGGRWELFGLLPRLPRAHIQGNDL
jgi:hypothetical protein